MSKEAYYFSHDSNARVDPKILEMRSVYKSQGYGWYWMLVEMMRDQEDYALSMQGKYVWNAFASQLDATAEEIEAFIKDCVSEFKLFESDGVKFWSKSLMQRMKKKEEKSEKARKSAEARWSKPSEEAKPMQPQCEGNANASKNDAIKERKVKENKDILNQQIADLWSMYPKKKGKDKAINKIPKLIDKFGYEQMVRTVERYSNEMQGTEAKYIKQGDTFFNGGYVDYLDENYKPDNKVIELKKTTETRPNAGAYKVIEY